MSAIESVSAVVEAAGFVGPPIVLAMLLSFAALGERFVILYGVRLASAREILGEVGRGPPRRPDVLTRAAAEVLARPPGREARRALTLLVHEDRRLLGRGATLIASAVRVCPLLGLLGTVAGMVETFDGLGATDGDAGQGVAAGIATALYSTELGLVVAVPGLLLGRLLDRRQARIEDELERLADLATARPAEGVEP